MEGQGTHAGIMSVAAVMRMHADCMTLDTVREDRGKVLPGWKGTRST